MNLDTLMFIVGQVKARMPQTPKRPPNALMGPYYNVWSDHLIKDCPYSKQPRPNLSLPTKLALIKYCLDFKIKHLMKECLLNSKNKGKLPLKTI